MFLFVVAGPFVVFFFLVVLWSDETLKLRLVLVVFVHVLACSDTHDYLCSFAEFQRVFSIHIWSRICHRLRSHVMQNFHLGSKFDVTLLEEVIVFHTL